MLKKSDKRTEWFQIMKAATRYAQFGLTLVTPLILCVLLAHWLKNRFQIGDWVILVAVLIGLASMALTFYHFACTLLYESRRKQEPQVQDSKDDCNENKA